MSLEIYAHNQWHSFDMKDLSSNEKMVEIHRLGVWVQSLQASGDELEYIRQRFENLPFADVIVRIFGTLKIGHYGKLKQNSKNGGSLNKNEK